MPRTGVQGADLYKPHLLKRATVFYGPLEVTLWRVICWVPSMREHKA